MSPKINLLNQDKIEVKCWHCEHTHFIQAKDLRKKVIKCLCGSKIVIMNGQIVKFQHPEEPIPAAVQLAAAVNQIHDAIWDFEMRLRQQLPLATMFYTFLWGVFILSFIKALLN